MLCLISNYNNFSKFIQEHPEEKKQSFEKNSIKNSNGEIISKLRFGTGVEPVDLDPHYSWDSPSIKVIDQVCEGLFTYDLSDPELSVIPNLASSFGTWSFDKMNYTIPLRVGIIFHDGTPFNATAVKWSFDRLNYFLNISGTLLPPKEVSSFDSVYKWPDNTPIINKTEIVNDYTIKFVLNRPFMPFISLLCFSGSYILSPSSTPSDENIDLAAGDLIGTGPFIYDNYIPGSGVNFHAFENYWRGKPSIDILNFTIIYDPVDRNNALLSGDIDLLDSPQLSYLGAFEADPNVIVVDAGSNAIIYSIGMNNKQINITMRKAISYAINYSYLIDEYMHGYVKRLKSPIPEGILYSNSSFNVPVMNITYARSILVDGGVCNFDIYNDAEWINAANFNPIATYNYTYYLYGYTYEISDLIQQNLEQIGIKVIDAGLTSANEYLDKILEKHDELQLFWFGWIPDYNDPDTFIRPLLSNSSKSNSAQVNDPWLENKIEDSLEESNDVIREAIYDEIQQYVVEDLVPWAFCYVGRNFDAYRNGIMGFQSNPLGILSFYNVSWKSFNIPFNGMSLNFTIESNYFGSGVGSVSYSQISANIFHMIGNLNLLTNWWDVNPYTRILTNTCGNFPIINGSHTPMWIFSNINIGDNVLISVDGEGDHTFEISDEKSINLPGYATLEAWELIDLTQPGGIAFYEKNTGILLNATFYYLGGLYYYTLILTGTNALTRNITQIKVDVYEISRNWERNPGTSLPRCKIQLAYNVSNLGTELISNVIINVTSNGDTIHEDFITEINVGDDYVSKFSLLMDYDTIKTLMVKAYYMGFSKDYEFVINATLPRALHGQDMRLFITPNDPLVLSTLNDILNSYPSIMPDWMAIRDWVGQMITYKSDKDEYGINEYFQLPRETILKKEGDCEDFSLLLVSLLRANGWDQSEVYVTIGVNETGDGYHAWVRLNFGFPLGWYNIEPQADVLCTFVGDYFALSGYEVISIFNDLQYETLQISASLHSPGELRVYDSLNRITGVINGVIKSEIPNSIYDQNNSIIALFSIDTNYRFQVFGIGSGEYGLEIFSLEHGSIVTFNAINIPIAANDLFQISIDWVSLSTGGQGVRIQIDLNGDGEFEYDFYSDNLFSLEEYLDIIRDLLGTPDIPGYNIIILICAFCLGILIVKKQLKKNT